MAAQPLENRDGDEFAVSEHEFLDKLNAEDSGATRERLDAEDSARIVAEGPQKLLGELEAFTRRQPITALLVALLVGFAAGTWIQR